jgi:hypothetical protein
MLVPAQYSGRVDDPLEPVTEGTTAGDLVFGMIRHNQHLFYPDLDASPPPAWGAIAPQTYKSFAGPNAFGMLIVDALDKDGIRRSGGGGSGGSARGVAHRTHGGQPGHAERGRRPGASAASSGAKPCPHTVLLLSRSYRPSDARWAL